MPTTKSAARTNAMVYKELLNHHLSQALLYYLKTCLRALMEISPDIKWIPYTGEDLLDPRLVEREPVGLAAISSRRTGPADNAGDGAHHAGDCMPIVLSDPPRRLRLNFID